MKREHFWITNIAIGFVVFGAAIVGGMVLPINPIPPIFIALVSVSWAAHSIFRFSDLDSMKQPLPVVLRWTCSVEGNCFTWRNRFFVEHPFLFVLSNRGGMLFFIVMVLGCTAGYGLILWEIVFNPFRFRAQPLWIIVPIFLFLLALLIAIWQMILATVRYPVNHTVTVDLDKRLVCCSGIRILWGALETTLPFAEIDGVLHHAMTTKYMIVVGHRLWLTHGKQRWILFNVLSNGDYAAIRGRLDECGEPVLREISQFPN
jgi:hypothetical protein